MQLIDAHLHNAGEISGFGDLILKFVPILIMSVYLRSFSMSHLSSAREPVL